MAIAPYQTARDFKAKVSKVKVSSPPVRLLKSIKVRLPTLPSFSAVMFQVLPASVPMSVLLLLLLPVIYSMLLKPVAPSCTLSAPLSPARLTLSCPA